MKCQGIFLPKNYLFCLKSKQTTKLYNILILALWVCCTPRPYIKRVTRQTLAFRTSCVCVSTHIDRKAKKRQFHYRFLCTVGCQGIHGVQNGRSTEILYKVWMPGHPRCKDCGFFLRCTVKVMVCRQYHLDLLFMKYAP